MSHPSMRRSRRTAAMACGVTALTLISPAAAHADPGFCPPGGLCGEPGIGGPGGPGLGDGPAMGLGPATGPGDFDRRPGLELGHPVARFLSDLCIVPLICPPPR